MALMETLTDDFTSGTIDTGKWTNVSSGVSIVSGRLQIVDSTGAYPVCSSAGSYDIRNSYAFAQVEPAPRTGSASQQTYFAYFASTGNGVGLAVGDTTLYKVVWNGGSETDTAIGTYNGTTMAWWRIRHDGTNIRLGYGSDGSSWTEISAFSPGITYTTTGWLMLNIGRYTSGDTATGYYDNINIPGSTPKSGSDTGAGSDSSGTAIGYYTGTETGSGVSNTGTLAVAESSTETGSGADNAGSLSATYTSTDTGTGTDSSGTTAQAYTGTETGSGVDNAGSLAASDTDAETGSGLDSAGSLAAALTSAETSSGTDNGGLLFTGADTFTGIESVSGRVLVNLDNPTIDEAGSKAIQGDVPKSGSETVTRTEGQSVALPGSFTQIPSPKVWSNGDDLYAGTLNKEWRDAFNWLLRATSPAFQAYNADGASLSFSPNVAIPLKTEELKRGNLTHATNDTKVYVWETGWYDVYTQVGLAVSGVTGTCFCSVLKVNGAVYTTADTTRSTGGTQVGVEHFSSAYLTAGDYVELAVGGSWSGTATAINTSQLLPLLAIWWRNN